MGGGWVEREERRGGEERRGEERRGGGRRGGEGRGGERRGERERGEERRGEERRGTEIQILIDSLFGSRVPGLEGYWGPTLEPGLGLGLVAEHLVAGPTGPGRPKRLVRVCWESLVGEPVRLVFNSHLRQSFDRVPRAVGDIESEWAMFRSAIVEAAVASCGCKAAGAGRDGNPRTRWWTPEVRGAVKLKKEAYRSWLVWSGLPGYLKALDVVGLSWLTRLCNIAWKSGTVPLDWQTGVVAPIFKKGAEPEGKALDYRSIYVPVLTYGRHQRWVMTERTRSRIQAAEMSFLPREAGLSLREEVFRTCPPGRRPRGRPRTRWRDYISRLAWERLGVPPEELMEVAGERLRRGGEEERRGREEEERRERGEERRGEERRGEERRGEERRGEERRGGERRGRRRGSV
ncbi:hypothetical protein D4764_08G0012640 [Takifugu flavidus]|uniref:Uncharacterized protein n=1 Tax=Takifugu flavidus TaxID=433684 RepID=A0A5C6MV76_9TELE|nr:hypothetical protein D4764_08G0012640 [Takifugu flavidus]